MKKHPLRSITKKIICTGTLTSSSTQTLDTKGNPVYPTTPLKLEFVVIVNSNQLAMRDIYSVDGIRKVVDLYIQRVWINNIENSTVNLNDINENMVSTDGVIKITIVDRTQSNLTPITRVFGKKLVAIADGNI